MIEPSFLSRTRAGYDAIAGAYAEHFAGELATNTWGRAVLTAFGELAAGSGPVVDIGSGPGWVTAYLAAQGVSVRGIDLSPAMVELARRSHPGIRFDTGSMTALDIPDGQLAGVVAWYSLIHIPAAERPRVFAEFHRVLRPGGRLLLGFQAGTDIRHYDEAFGQPVSLDFRRLSPEETADALEAAGFAVDVRFVRGPAGAETTPQAALMAIRSS